MSHNGNPFSQINADGLPSLYELIWNQLTMAVTNVEHGWRLPVLGTTCRADHSHDFSLRILVLRAVDRDRMTFDCHTDIRSAKIGHLEADPRVSALFYDANLRVQVRVLAEATLHSDDDVARQCWRQTPLSSRRAYLAPAGPGTVAPEPTTNLPPAVQGRIPSEEECEAGWPNFVVIRCRAVALDWLLLQPQGNLGATFSIDDDGTVSSSWMAS